MTKPFIKAVGGKTRILPELVKRLPKEYSGYCEPFVGGGALFFKVQPKNAVLADANARLITTYTQVRDNVSGVASQLYELEKQHDAETYYFVREQLEHFQDTPESAAHFIYINKTCYNGLYRENKQGVFNVPMGKYDDPNIYDPEVLQACSEALQGVTLINSDFRNIQPAKDCFYYLDPPYYKTFSSYTKHSFSEENHRQLASLCDSITDVGGYFLLSNSDELVIRELYKEYKIETINTQKSISCKQRKRSYELLISNY